MVEQSRPSTHYSILYTVKRTPHIHVLHAPYNILQAGPIGRDGLDGFELQEAKAD